MASPLSLTSISTGNFLPNLPAAWSQPLGQAQRIQRVDAVKELRRARRLVRLQMADEVAFNVSSAFWTERRGASCAFAAVFTAHPRSSSMAAVISRTSGSSSTNRTTRDTFGSLTPNRSRMRNG